MLIPVAIFGQAIGTAAYPFMARLAAEEKMEEMNNLLNNTLRYLALVIPVSVLLMVLKNEVVRIIYQRGQFDASATTLLCHAKHCISCNLWQHRGLTKYPFLLFRITILWIEGYCFSHFAVRYSSGVFFVYAVEQKEL
jgi:putative peptidoglycan lipid II flippase